MSFLAKICNGLGVNRMRGGRSRRPQFPEVPLDSARRAPTKLNRQNTLGKHILACDDWKRIKLCFKSMKPSDSLSLRGTHIKKSGFSDDFEHVCKHIAEKFVADINNRTPGCFGTPSLKEDAKFVGEFLARNVSNRTPMQRDALCDIFDESTRPLLGLSEKQYNTFFRCLDERHDTRNDLESEAAELHLRMISVSSAKIT